MIYDFAQYRLMYDHPAQVPPDELDMVPCWPCNGTGYLCDDGHKWDPTCFRDPKLARTRLAMRTDECLENHACPMCYGEGNVKAPTKKEMED